MSAFDIVVSGVKDMGTRVKSAFSTMKDHIKNFDFKEFMEKVKQLPSKVSSSFKSLVSGATTALKELAGKAKASVKQIPSILEGGFKGAGEKLSAFSVLHRRGSTKNDDSRTCWRCCSGSSRDRRIYRIVSEDLMESSEAFREKITAAWAQVKEALQPAIDAFNTFKESIMGISRKRMPLIPSWRVSAMVS